MLLIILVVPSLSLSISRSLRRGSTMLDGAAFAHVYNMCVYAYIYIYIYIVVIVSSVGTVVIMIVTITIGVNHRHCHC